MSEARWRAVINREPLKKLRKQFLGCPPNEDTGVSCDRSETVKKNAKAFFRFST